MKNFLESVGKVIGIRKLLFTALLLSLCTVLPKNTNALIIFQNEIYQTDAETLLLDQDNDAPADLAIQFGQTLAETIAYNVSLARFEISEKTFINGPLELNGNLDLNSFQSIEQRIENVSALPGGAGGLGLGGAGRIVILDTPDLIAPGCTINPNCAAGTYIWDGTVWISLVGSATATNLTKVVTVGPVDSDYTTIEDAAEYLSQRSGGIMLLAAATHAVTTSINMTNINVVGKDASRSTIQISGNGQLDSFDTRFSFLKIDVNSINDDMAIDVQTGATSLTFEYVDFDVQDSGDVIIDSNAGSPPTITAKFIKSNSTGGSGTIVKSVGTANLNGSSDIFIDSRSSDSPLQMVDWPVTLAGGGSVYTTGIITSVPAQSIFVSPNMNLQSAIDSLESTNQGGLITLLPGTHNISQTLTIEDDNIKIEGYGDSSLIVASGFSGIDSSTAAIQIGAVDGSSAVNGVSLNNFKLEVNQNIHGIRITGGENNQIQNVTIQKTGETAGSGASAKMGIMALDAQSEKLVRVVIKGNRVFGGGGSIYFTDGIHVSSKTNLSGVWGFGQGVSNALVEGNFVDYVRETTYVFVGASDSSLFNNRGTRMGVGGTSAYGIYMGSISDVNMNANVFSTSLSTQGIGIGIEGFNLGSLQTSTDNIFASNIIDGTNDGGVGFDTGFQIGNASNTAVHRNAFLNNTIVGASNTTTDAILLRGNADDNSFTHNNISGGTNPWDTGINLQSSTQDRTSIRDNIFTNVTSIINDGGTATTVNSLNHRATSNPTVNDDLNDGYLVGTFWVNTTSDVSFILVDSTPGAAVWNQIDGSAGSITGVDSNTFTIDQDNTGGNVTLRFGTTNNETLVWNSSGSRFDLSDDLFINNNLFVGSATETISEPAFVLDGNDAFIAGTLGVEGQIYSDATASKYLWLDIEGAVRGSATVGTIAGGRSPVIRFDELTNSQIRYSFPVPDDWVSGTNMTLEVFWSPENANAGNIDFNLDYGSFGDGDNVVAGNFTTATVPTVSTPGVTQQLDVFGITLSSAQLGANEMVNFVLDRTPQTGTDTYTGDINIHMIRITYTGKKII